MIPLETPPESRTPGFPPPSPDHARVLEAQRSAEAIRLQEAQKVVSLSAQQEALTTHTNIDGVDSAAEKVWDTKRHTQWNAKQAQLDIQIADAIAAKDPTKSDEQIKTEVIQKAHQEWVTQWATGLVVNKTVFADGYNFAQDSILKQLGFDGAKNITDFLAGDFYNNYCGKDGVKLIAEKLLEGINDINPNDVNAYALVNERRKAIMESPFLKAVFGSDDLRNACVALTTELRIAPKFGINDAARTRAIQENPVTSAPYGEYAINQHAMLDLLKQTTDQNYDAQNNQRLRDQRVRIQEQERQRLEEERRRQQEADRSAELELRKYDVGLKTEPSEEHKIYEDNVNQDTVYTNAERGIIGVWDGASRPNGGEYASRIVRDSTTQELEKLLYPPTKEQIFAAMKRGLDNAKSQLLLEEETQYIKYKQRVEEEKGNETGNIYKGMATTATVAQLYQEGSKQMVAIMQAGDSRAYAVKKDGTLVQLTQDVRDGSDGNNWIGANSPNKPVYITRELGSDIAYIIALSDGVHNDNPDAVLQELIRGLVLKNASAQKIAEALVTKQMLVNDDSTAAVIKIPEQTLEATAPIVQAGEKTKKPEVKGRPIARNANMTNVAIHQAEGGPVTFTHKGTEIPGRTYENGNLHVEIPDGEIAVLLIDKPNSTTIAQYEPLANGIGLRADILKTFLDIKEESNGAAIAEVQEVVEYMISHELNHLFWDQLSQSEKSEIIKLFLSPPLLGATKKFADQLINSRGLYYGNRGKVYVRESTNRPEYRVVKSFDYTTNSWVEEYILKSDLDMNYLSLDFRVDEATTERRLYSKELLVMELLGHAAVPITQENAENPVILGEKIQRINDNVRKYNMLAIAVSQESEYDKARPKGIVTMKVSLETILSVKKLHPDLYKLLHDARLVQYDGFEGDFEKILLAAEELIVR